MEHFVFAVRDVKLGEFLPGFFVERSVASGLRNVAETFHGSGSMIEKYAEDHELYQIGMIELRDGSWVSIDDSRVVPIASIAKILEDHGYGRDTRP